MANNPLKTAEYWKGYNDSQKQSERNWTRAKAELNARFIEILEGAKEVKGIGPKSHVALVEYGLRIMIGEEQTASAQEQISKKERSRIIKELANTKWSGLSDTQLIQIQNILSLNSTEQA